MSSIENRLDKLEAEVERVKGPSAPSGLQPIPLEKRHQWIVPPGGEHRCSPAYLASFKEQKLKELHAELGPFDDSSVDWRPIVWVAARDGKRVENDEEGN